MDVTALPFEIERLPKRRLFAGAATSVLGYAAATVLILGSIAFLDAEEVPGWLGLGTFLVGLVLASVCMLLLPARGRRMRQWDALSVLAQDRRAPVFILRSFADDDVHDLTSRTGRVGLHRAEDNLCRALRRLGPVVAIGRPGERLPEVGAARLYVSDRTWKEAVRFFLDEAVAVVVVVGRSSGVWWEIRTTMERVGRERILFYFPFAGAVGSRHGLGHMLRMRWLSAEAYRDMSRERDERFAVFRKEIGETVAQSLPVVLGSCQFVDFAPDGRPRALTTVRPSGLDSLMQLSVANSRIGVHFERTLEPFLAKHGRG